MILWFERITVPKLFFAIGYKYFVSKIEVRFPYISFSANTILKTINKLEFLKWIQQAELLLGMVTEKGENLRYKAEEVIDKVTKELTNRLLDQPNAIPYHLREYHSRIRMAFHSYLLFYFFKQKIYFLCAVDYLHKSDPLFKGKKLFYWVESIPLFSEFKKAISSHLEGELKLWPNVINGAKQILPLKVFYSFLGSFIASRTARRRLKKNNEDLSEDASGKILVEFFRLRVVSNDIAHLFWFPRSDIPQEKIILGFDRKDSPCSKENIEFIEEHHMRWLDLKTSTLSHHVSKPLRILLQSLLHTPFPKKSCRASSILRWKIMLEYSYFLQVWREIFRKYNIKVFHQHQEHTFWSHIQSLAIRLEGGVYFWYHWSLDRFPVAHFNSGCCDVYFSWGKFHRDYLESHNFEYRYLLDIGLIWDGAYQRKTGQVTPSFNKPGKKINFTIGLFDAGNHPWSQYSPHDESYFYTYMLQMILNHPTWGVLIKSKRYNFLVNIPNRDKIENLIKKLTLQSRCILLSGRYSPLDIAGQADVYVCFCINSAGAILALSGSKVIYWDLSGHSRHPFYLNSRGQFLFNSEKKVSEALESIFLNKKEQREIGDHSDWFDMLDSYRDGKAGLRAGQFIRSFLRHAEDGDDGDKALNKAVAKFAEDWGNDKVHIYETKKKRLADNIWLKAEKALKK